MNKPKTQPAKLEQIPAVTPKSKPAKNGRGQPKAIDEKKQATICSLVNDGISLRQAARFIGCDPKSIRREARRNKEFRVALGKARTAANVHPIQTLRRAAKDDWRAALSWLQCTDPDRFTRRHDSIVTKREANSFIDHFFGSIEQAISDLDERENLYELLSLRIPVAMQARWNLHAMQLADECAELRRKQQKLAAYNQKQALITRNFQREKLFREIIDYVPSDLKRRLNLDVSLFDPDEVSAHIDELARRKKAAASSNAPPAPVTAAETAQTTDANKASQ